MRNKQNAVSVEYPVRPIHAKMEFHVPLAVITKKDGHIDYVLLDVKIQEQDYLRAAATICNQKDPNKQKAFADAIKRALPADHQLANENAPLLRLCNPNKKQQVDELLKSQPRGGFRFENLCSMFVQYGDVTQSDCAIPYMFRIKARYGKSEANLCEGTFVVPSHKNSNGYSQKLHVSLDKTEGEHYTLHMQKGKDGDCISIDASEVMREIEHPYLSPYLEQVETLIARSAKEFVDLPAEEQSMSWAIEDLRSMQSFGPFPNLPPVPGIEPADLTSEELDEVAEIQRVSAQQHDYLLAGYSLDDLLNQDDDLEL